MQSYRCDQIRLVRHYFRETFKFTITISSRENSRRNKRSTIGYILVRRGKRTKNKSEKNDREKLQITVEGKIHFFFCIFSHITRCYRTMIKKKIPG